MNTNILNMVTQIECDCLGAMKFNGNSLVAMKFNGKRKSCLLKAYNTYQEENRDGVDYLFSLENGHDLAVCFEGGIKIEDVADMHNHYVNDGATEYFLFGVNYDRPKQITSIEELNTTIEDCLREIIHSALLCPWAYKDFYNEFIVPFFEDFEP